MNETSKAVFLSYASQDAEAARRICEALRGAGIEVWLDQSELRGGDAWDAAIRKQVKTCALFIPIISANTCARAEGYFRLEWKLAIDRSLCSAITRSRRRGRRQIFVMQATQHRSGAHPEGYCQINSRAWADATHSSAQCPMTPRQRPLRPSYELSAAPRTPLFRAKKVNLSAPSRTPRDRFE